jgi:ATP-binding cassette subfamily B (MDR/TAP) protein 6
VFSIIPTIADIFIAIFYFTIAFNYSFGLLVFLTMLFYVVATVAVTEWRTQFRRQMIELDNDARAKAVDSLLNFETVKYYCAEEYEGSRYDDAIVAYQKADWVTLASLSLLNSAQNLVITIGLLVGCLMCGKQVANGSLKIGDFVLFMSYINQLYGPVWKRLRCESWFNHTRSLTFLGLSIA